MASTTRSVPVGPRAVLSSMSRSGNRRSGTASPVRFALSNGIPLRFPFLSYCSAKAWPSYVLSPLRSFAVEWVLRNRIGASNARTVSVMSSSAVYWFRLFGPVS